MARKKNEVSVAAPPQFPKKAAARLEKLQNEASDRLAEVLTKFGDGLPFDALRYEDKIRGHLSRSADEMLAAGRALVVVREHVPHGEWGGFLGRLGLEERLARRMCQAAVKFSNRALTPDLVKAAGNKTKLFELMVLDDEDIQELNDGGTVAGLNLDEVARMSTAELRQQVRDLQAERQATQKLLADKNEKMDTLRRNLEQAMNPKPRVRPADEQKQALSHQLAAAALDAERTVNVKLHAAIAALLAHGEQTGERQGGVSLAAGCVMQVQQALNDLRDAFELPAFQDYVPRWLPDGAAEGITAMGAPFMAGDDDVNLADLAVDPAVVAANNLQ